MRRREFVMFASGAAITWPPASRAQQGAMRVIGYLGATAPGPAAPFMAAFRQGLSDTGYVEAKNLAIEYRWAENQFDRLPALAADLVSRKVEMIVTGGGPASAVAAKNATSTIPILFTAVGDPIEAGLISNMARPGGNITGFSVLVVELNSKRLGLLTELVPEGKVIALLVNPDTSSTERVVRDVGDAARAKGLQLLVLKASSELEVDAAFAALVRQQANALIVGSDAVFFNRREELVALASRSAVPAIYEWREFVEIGGLASYGPRLPDILRQAGVYAGRILNGEKPANLPVQAPTKFELALNLRTANTLGITIPQAILASADEVIE